MPTLLSKDEPLRASAVYTGYLLLKALKASPDGRITLRDAADQLRKAGVSHSRPLLFGAMFLFSTGLVQFAPPYLVCLDSDSDD